MKEDLIQKLTEIYKPDLKVYFVYSDSHKEKVRIGKGTSGLIVMAKGSSRRGYYIDSPNFNNVIEIKALKEKPISDKWTKSIIKAITLLEKSGLWEEQLSDLKIALSIGYNKIKLAYDLSNGNYNKDYTENEKIRTQKIKEVDTRLIRISEGIESFKTSIIWYLAYPLRIKKMNFGIRNSEYKSNIAYALLHKEKLIIPRIVVNYDISFEYNPEQNKAWYSEEYRNCGNGHYYLALNNEYALFYEDD